MTMRYFAETDTLKIQLTETPGVNTRELGENAVLDVDAEGNVCAVTIARVSQHGGTPQFYYEQVA